MKLHCGSFWYQHLWHKEIFQNISPQSHLSPLFFCQIFKLCGWIILNNLSLFHINKPIRQPTQIIQAMLRYNNRFSLFLPVSDYSSQIHDWSCIQIRRGFVQDKNIRFHDRNPCTGNLLLLSTWKLKNIASNQFFQMQLLNCSLQSIFDFFLWHSKIFTSKSNLACCIYIKKLWPWILKNTSNNFCCIIQWLLRNIYPIYPYLTS